MPHDFENPVTFGRYRHFQYTPEVSTAAAAKPDPFFERAIRQVAEVEKTLQALQDFHDTITSPKKERSRPKATLLSDLLGNWTGIEAAAKALNKTLGIKVTEVENRQLLTDAATNYLFTLVQLGLVSYDETKEALRWVNPPQNPPSPSDPSTP